MASEDPEAELEKILHTTGSTGIPKLVPISHSTLAATDAHRLISRKDSGGAKCQLELMTDARAVYVAFPLFHVAGFSFACYLLLSGVSLILGYPGQPPNTLMLRIAFKHPSLDGALLPPSLVEDLSHDSVLMDNIRKLNWIFSGGGRLFYNIT
jgi:acyl-CoA synthetase (AMP-forming)/AMP-acid ligase II